jgi:general secretion pathway protein L
MFILQLFSDQTVDWFEINESGELHSRQHIASLSECPKINPSDDLIVLLPGENIMITSVKLPKMRASERARAVPFALEEQLAVDPESITVALGETTPEGITTVAVSQTIEFEAQLAALAEANYFPQAALPDFLALNLEPNTWSVLIQNQTALVRTQAQKGFSADVNNLFLLLQLQLEKNKENKPQKIIFWHDDTIVDVKTYEKLDIPIEVRGESKEGYFDTKMLLAKSAINLLQGKYTPKSRSSSIRKNWMLCGTAVAALIVFLFLSQCGQWFYFRHQSIVLEKNVLTVYRTLFPGATDVLEPRFRTASLLKQFDSASKGNTFAHLLNIAGKTVLSLPDIQIQTIHFENNQLQLNVTAKTIAQLSQWSQALRNEEIIVTQRVLKTSKDNLSAEITLSDRQASTNQATSS